MMGRVLSMVLALTVMTSGCGFHPVYGVRGPGRSLAAVYVGVIANRSGQLLRQALQARLQGSDSGVAQRYVLDVSYFDFVQGVGVQADNSTTRTRDVGNASWSLHPAGDASVSLANGHVRSVDGSNVIDEQFFYGDLAEDATQRRLAQSLADQIVLGLGLYFDRHPDHA